MENLTISPVTFTQKAIEKIQTLLDAEKDKNKSLRIGVKGGGCSGLTYVLDFDQANDGDQYFNYEELTFIMDKKHQLYLDKMTIDYDDGLNSRGFVFINPNASDTCGCGTSFSI